MDKKYIKLQLTDKDIVEPLDTDIINTTRASIDKFAEKIVEKIHGHVMETFKKYGYDEEWLIYNNERVKMTVYENSPNRIYIFSVDERDLFELHTRFTGTGVGWGISDLTGEIEDE